MKTQFKDYSATMFAGIDFESVIQHGDNVKFKIEGHIELSLFVKTDNTIGIEVMDTFLNSIEKTINGEVTTIEGVSACVEFCLKFESMYGIDICDTVQKKFMAENDAKTVYTAIIMDFQQFA